MRMTFVVNIELDRDDPGFETQFLEYLTAEEGPFVTDFGPDAWGGYEGPKVERVEVSRDGLIKSSWKAE